MMLPQDFDPTAPREEQVRRLVESEFYDEHQAEVMVDLLAGDDPDAVLL